jgi:TM2 domain-containing membrane protein YozV
MSTGPGTAGNVIAAICSLVVPGLGQLVQGRILWALIWLLLAALAGAITWLITVGLAPFGWFLISIFAAIHAAVYRGRD